MRWWAFGTYDRARHPRVAVLIEGLRALGDEVVEINEPLRLDTAGRVAMLRQPWRLPLLAGKLVRCWAMLARGARRAGRTERAERAGRAERAERAERADRPDAVLVGYLGHFDVRLARVLFRRTPIILDHLVSAAGTASDRGLAGSGGVKARLLRAIDDGALRRADVVIVDTAEHEEALPTEARAKAVIVPVGAGEAWFARAEDRDARCGDAPLTVVFVGVFTPLHGTRTIGAAIAALAGDDVEFTMVGTGQDYAACREAAAENSRVTWLDWVPVEDLPALVSAHDVSLGIFGTTVKARAVVPTKVYQGAAAGCAIITSDTAPQRAALLDAALLLPPGDAGALTAALRRLANDRRELARLQTAAYERAVAGFTPAAVVEALRERVGGVARAR